MSYQALRTFFMYISLFLVGGFIYGIIEVTYRGYTHPSMFILGGVCLILIGLMRRYLPPQTPYIVLLLFCAILISSLEFFTGVIVNLYLHMNVWDYSAMPWNLWGQVCMPFFILWFLISVPALSVDTLIRQKCWGQKRLESVASDVSDTNWAKVAATPGGQTPENKQV